jgi:hypothetical protein
MLVATGHELTVLQATTDAELNAFLGGFDLFSASDAISPRPLRARFRGLELLGVPLYPLGDGSVTPGGVLGGNLLASYSIDFRFAETCAASAAGCASMTFWPQLGADDGFLGAAGYAVIHFAPLGGGELTANGTPDFVGLRGPLVVPPSRVVMRTCAVPEPFDRAGPRQACCTRAAAASPSVATGVNLSLLVETGVGPLILDQSAWRRLTQGSLVPLVEPTPMDGSLRVGTWPTPMNAAWTTIPRFALVDLQVGSNDDPGACVELARARRIEWVAYQNSIDNPVCVQPCDTDQREPSKAQTSAAYLELYGQIPVAVIADDEEFMQALRASVRPEGPELDGLIGAGALGRARLELDYTSEGPRAVFSCEPDDARASCWAAASCPRLPGQGEVHTCFDLGPQSLPPTCAPNGC